jgi:hypothetical protein
MISRRHFLLLLGSGYVGKTQAQLDPNREAQRKAAMQEAVRKVTGGAPVRPGKVATRARIADTQTVTAIAQLSDGSFWSDSVEVVVTLSACLEEGLI